MKSKTTHTETCTKIKNQAQGTVPATGSNTSAEIEDYFLTHYDLLLSLAASYKGRSDYQEIVEAAFVGALKGLQSYNPSKSIDRDSYAFTCALNEVVMYLYKKGVKGNTSNL